MARRPFKGVCPRSPLRYLVFVAAVTVYCAEDTGRLEEARTSTESDLGGRDDWLDMDSGTEDGEILDAGESPGDAEQDRLCEEVVAIQGGVLQSTCADPQCTSARFSERSIDGFAIDRFEVSLIVTMRNVCFQAFVDLHHAPGRQPPLWCASVAMTQLSSV